MDVDPLADTQPPRYAIESDDEEDEAHPIHSNSTSTPQKVAVTFLGDTAPLVGKPLLIASADAGPVYARGAALGQQVGAVAVDGVQIGLVFSPEWTRATVIVSEALTRLPLHAMHPYAQAVLDKLQPSRLALIDTYAVPAYLSSAPTSVHDAPLRYLSTLTSSSDLAFLESSAACPFAPPNLLQSTSAAFLSLASLSSSSSTLVLLPTSHIPAPAPKSLAPASVAHLDPDADTADGHTWPAELMDTAQRLALAALGLDAGREWELDARHAGASAGAGGKTRRGDVGDGGMYI